MAFNHRFPEIPALDTAALVTLMRDPQKAAELWDRYSVARAEYEAARTAIAEQTAKLNAREKTVVESETTVALKEGAATQLLADLKAQKDLLLKQVDQRQRALDERERSLDLTAKAQTDSYNELNRQRLAWEAQVAKDHAEFEACEKRLEELADAVAAREEAVAKREEKAEKLAALLKSV